MPLRGAAAQRSLNPLYVESRIMLAILREACAACGGFGRRDATASHASRKVARGQWSDEPGQSAESPP